jgi:predicted MarR family transcription regulator
MSEHPQLKDQPIQAIKSTDTDIEPTDQLWHLGETDMEVKLSEFEFLLWRLFYSFTKWHEDCQGCVSNDDISADEIALMHLIRMRDRPKTIYEIARLMNRDDMPNLQYSLRKFLKLNIIKKSKKSAKKAIAYEITEKGIKMTDRYGEVRRDILVKMLKGSKHTEWESIYKTLTEYKNMYDEACRQAALAKA